MHEYRIKDLLDDDLIKKISRSKDWEARITPYAFRSTWDILIVDSSLNHDISIKRKGEPLFQIKVSSFFSENKYDIVAPYDGIYTVSSPLVHALTNATIIRHFDTAKEFGDFYISQYYSHEIVFDDFEDSQYVIWSEKRTSLIINGFCQYPYLMFGIDVSSFGVYFKLSWHSSWRKNYEMYKGDVITIVLNNNEKIILTSVNNASRVAHTKAELQELFPITEKQLYQLANNPIVAWKIDFFNGDESFVSGRGDNNFYKSEIFCAYARKNIELLHQCNRDSNVLGDNTINTNINTSTSVYLMHDTTNGYYKIGISNYPEYRERTLQSEKPTIELVIAKEFPVRRIAEAFETALHKTYEAKRLRGEWFRLDSNDVQDLIKALS